MTKDQKEAINNLKKYIKEDVIYNSERKDLSDFDKVCINHCTDIKIALDLIDTQQLYINFYKKGLEREIEDNREKILEIIKQDKVIDLMAEYIKAPYKILAMGSRMPKKQIIKQYFYEKEGERNE